MTKLPAYTEARSCNRYDQGSSLPCYAADARLRRSWTNNFFYRDRASSRACTAKTLCGHAGFFRVSRRLRSNGDFGCRSSEGHANDHALADYDYDGAETLSGRTSSSPTTASSISTFQKATAPNAWT